MNDCFICRLYREKAIRKIFLFLLKKERTLKSSRGNIYDRNGKAIAYNELSYCVTFEDSETYNTTHEKNLALNSILYHVIKMIEEQGDSIVDDFEIGQADDGSWEIYGIRLHSEPV